MDVSLLFLAILLALIISLNVIGYLAFKLRRAAKTPQPTQDAQQLLAAFASGNALLRITVLDPGDIFIKSPRG